MKTKFSTLVFKALLCLSVMGFSNVAIAQTNDEPIITFKTNIYDSYGEANQFSLVIGTIDAGQYVDVDCGFGKIEYETQQAYMDSLNQMGGTFISCQVSSEGIVKIYGDPSQIDYFNASGCYISSIEFNNCNNMMILDLTHNELKSLDLSNMPNLQAIYVSDNTFSKESPLKIGKNKPNLTILEMNTIEYLDPEFNLSDYPNLMSFDGYHNLGLKYCDPTGCPNLMRLTLDVTDVESVDVSKNPYLMILNVANTKVTSLDLSKNPNLTELYCGHYSSFNTEYKFTELDVTNNPNLKYLFCEGNKLTSLDISKCPKLITVSATDNYLTSFDVSQNPNLYIVEINNNCLDFATLPLDPGTWNTYYYGQRNFPVERSYKVGSSFDYSSRVLREGTITDAALYSVSEESGSPALVDASYYTYENGVMTINKIPEDSVYIAFANSMFPDAMLMTDKFKIKSEEEFGDSIKAFSFTSGAANGTTMSFGIGVAGASPENPKEIYVCFGDYSSQTFTVTTSGIPSTPNVNGTKNGYGEITVFVKEGDDLTAIDVKDIPMYSADVTTSPTLAFLNLVNAGLYSIDLSWNRCLASLNLSGNKFSTLSLAGANGNYAKNILSDINLSNNNLSELTLNDMRAVRNLNISNNQLSTLDLSFGDYVENIDISNNLFTDINLGYCACLKSFKASNNQLTSITMPEVNVLEYFTCDNNYFTLATLPSRGNIAEESFIYAPQADYQIATKGPCTDLSSQNIVNGVQTTFTWKDNNGKILTEGVDYSVSNGVTRFINTSVGDIYCEMTNATLPAFTGENVYKTTQIEAAGMPTNEIASFHTLNEGDSVTLSLAAAKAGTAVYFDWSGDNNVIQYVLGDTYRIFGALTKGNKDVKVYTYEPTEDITVFSMSGAKLSSFDGSKLMNAINVSIYNAGLSEITLPQSTKFVELALDGNNFTNFDLEKYPYLETVSLNDNQLTDIDLSKNSYLQIASIANNQLSNITLNNNNLWALYLDNNKFSKIDLSGAPNITQLSLGYNALENINVDVLPKLRVLALNNNKLTFKTLPIHKSTYSVYYYQNQANIDAVATEDGVIDLSDQALVGTTNTTYRWFLNVPVINEEGNLEGEELILGTEYTLENGVTKFLKDFEGVMCVMTNAALPNIYLCTNLMDVTAGVECVLSDDAKTMVFVDNNSILVKSSANNSTNVNLVSMNGSIIATTEVVDGYAIFNDVTKGIYIVTVGNRSHKVAVK